jgi:hypothetical protein
MTRIASCLIALLAGAEVIYTICPALLCRNVLMVMNDGNVAVTLVNPQLGTRNAQHIAYVTVRSRHA